MNNLLYSLFSKPKVIGLVADIDEGKSNLIYYLIDDLVKKGNKNIVSFGLKKSLGEREIYTLKELEACKNNIIFLDEMMTLFDLDNRMAKKQIENTLRLIAHNNNVLVLCGLPENFKKFLCGKISVWLLKKVTIEDFIRGSSVKRVVTDYHGNERGTEILSLDKGEVILFNGHYTKINVPYLSQFDTKKNNIPLLKVSVNGNVNVKTYRNVSQNVNGNVNHTTKTEENNGG